MKVWVVVYNYGLVNDSVGVFRSLEDARLGFREYTGFEWSPERRWKEVGGEEYSEYYEQCDVFECEGQIVLTPHIWYTICGCYPSNLVYKSPPIFGNEIEVYPSNLGSHLRGVPLGSGREPVCGVGVFVSGLLQDLGGGFDFGFQKGKEVGCEEYSEEYGECDVFEGEIM